MPDPDLARATEGAIPSAQCAHFKKTSVPSSIFVPRACLFDCMKEYWSFFATIDEDLHHFSRFVEFSEDNYKTYSAHLVRLYLAIGSEIDVVAKLLCRQIDSQKRPERINQYRPVITGRYPKLQDLQIHVRGTSITLTPWSDWNLGQSPNWWGKYNDVKHKRHEYFKDACLENVLTSAAGLLVLLVYLCHKELFEVESPDPALRKNPEVRPDFRVFELDRRYVTGPMAFGYNYDSPDLGGHSRQPYGIGVVSPGSPSE